eukprot:COSAG05_NODE_14_length_36349_cov_27.641655_16_plen_146_part_00
MIYTTYCRCRQVTGSLDATVAVWDVAPSSATSVPIVSSAPRAVLYGHRDEITCTAVHTGLGIVASASKHGPCLLHKARGGSYIRSIPSVRSASQCCSHARRTLSECRSPATLAGGCRRERSVNPAIGGRRTRRCRGVVRQGAGVL